MTWRNIIMYNAAIPDPDDSDTSNSDGASSSSTVTGSISLFDIGKRLSEGKGV